jgi:hypothetical protein
MTNGMAGVVDELSPVGHHDRGSAHLRRPGGQQDGDDPRAHGQVGLQDTLPARRQPAIGEEQDDQRQHQEDHNPQLRGDHHGRRAERQSPAVEAVIPDRVSRSVPVDGEHPAESEQQPGDAVGGLAPGDHQPEKRDGKRGEGEASARMPGDGERYGHTEQHQDQRAQRDERRRPGPPGRVQRC